MHLLDLLKNINPNFKELITQDILDVNNEIIGTKCYGIENESDVFAGGTASLHQTAMRIAIAEAFERSYIDIISKDSIFAETFDMKNYPSSSGFAAGFNDDSTKFRAICEGLERWIWSKWIDENFMIEKISLPSTTMLSPLTNHLLKSFDNVSWYKKDFVIDIPQSKSLNLQILIFLGFNKNGVFPGSRVSTQIDDLYQHPVIEAHRNLSNYLLDKKNSRHLLDIIQKRTFYFGENKQHALTQVNQALKTEWPIPEIRLLEKFDTHSNEVFLYRCLFKNFIGWHEGATDRFVY